jgi:hypothetical protein
MMACTRWRSIKSRVAAVTSSAVWFLLSTTVGSSLRPRIPPSALISSQGELETVLVLDAVDCERTGQGNHRADGNSPALLLRRRFIDACEQRAARRTGGQRESGTAQQIATACRRAVARHCGSGMAYSIILRICLITHDRRPSVRVGVRIPVALGWNFGAS